MKGYPIKVDKVNQKICQSMDIGATYVMDYQMMI